MRAPARRLTGCLAPGILVVGFATGAAAQTHGPELTAAEKSAGWVSLFDGHSLEGWRGYMRPDAANTRWTIADGNLCVAPGTGADTRGQRDIVTKDTYDRFELRWEWRVDEGGNSGLKYFVLEDQPAAIGHEYQMIDDERHPDAKRGPTRQTAALYDVFGAVNRPVKPAGQWNQSRIVVSDMKVEHWLNGTKVLDYELGSPQLKEAIAKSKFNTVPRFGTLQKAHILLQDHGEAVCYRGIAIRR